MSLSRRVVRNPIENISPVDDKPFTEVARQLT
ncbi:hypothetical protein HDC95_002786 [Microbacterium sp. AK031]|nr:hypothetical protein [Microbacterium sp. AK031]